MFERSSSGELVRLSISPCSIIRRPMPHHKMGLSYTTTGYGEKIPTEYMVRTIDSRWRRVYCRIFSNVGTLYVIHGGNKTIISLPFGDY